MSLFELTSRQFRRIYVLIDALDELDTELRPAFLSFIRRLSQLSIKTMVTSRPHVKLMESGLCLQISATDSDIKQYIKYRLNKKIQLSSDLKTEVLEALNTGADGM
jgi:hypothetical protein